jgi:predicted ATPase
VTEVARLLGKSKAGFPIPDNVKSALSRRLSNLSDLANRLLIAASVIGREVELEVLERTLVDWDRGEVLRTLGETVRALIIEPIPSTGERYQFRHALIRDALNEELSPTSKAEWHARVGEALEGLGGRAPDRAVELAHHVARAGRLMSRQKVMKYSSVAGQRMLALHAYEEALPHFERA